MKKLTGNEISSVFPENSFQNEMRVCLRTHRIFSYLSSTNNGVSYMENQNWIVSKNFHFSAQKDAFSGSSRSSADWSYKIINQISRIIFITFQRSKQDISCFPKEMFSSIKIFGIWILVSIFNYLFSFLRENFEKIISNWGTTWHWATC